MTGWTRQQAWPGRHVKVLAFSAIELAGVIGKYGGKCRDGAAWPPHGMAPTLVSPSAMRSALCGR